MPVSTSGDTVSVAASKVTVDDLLNLHQVSDAQVHPDGAVVAYVVAPSVSETGQQTIPSAIWLTDVGTGRCRQISAEGTRATQPRWSPDGSALAFLGRRALSAPEQVHLLDGGWGEARRLTNHVAGISDFAWHPDGTSLLILAEDEYDGVDERVESGRDWVEYEASPRFTRLWHVDATSGDAKTIIEDDLDLQIWEIAISPDGASVAALVSDSPFNWSWYSARLVLIDLESGHVTPLNAPEKQMTGLTCSPDGETLTLISCTWSDQGMTGGDVVLVSPGLEEVRTITSGHPRSYLSAVWDADETRLICAAIEDGESEIGFLSLDGTWHPVWREAASILRWTGEPFTVSRTNDRTLLAAVISRPQSPSDVHVGELTSDSIAWRRLTDANPTLRDRLLPAMESLHWDSLDGTRVQGFLVRPIEDPERPLPTIVLIHGGPTSLWSPEFHGTRSMGWVQLLAAEGYAVFLPNPRGSMGFGTAFAEANIGDMGGGDLADILAGVEHLVNSGIADPDRLGVGGWSYGGYLTPWAITQTTRFKAAVSGGSITNWVSFHGVSTIPAFDSIFYRADPFNWDGHYGQFSPMAHVRNVTTPTLFLHGERDPICPPGQAYEMWRALKELGVETQAVTYPREGHGPREREHLRDVLERGVGWWKRLV